MSHEATHRAIETVWRIESARLIAGLARMVNDIGQAEDLAQDALLIALEKWPESGVPDNPGAWLMATAKRRAIDLHRRHRMMETKHEQIAVEVEVSDRDPEAQLHQSLDDPIGDDLLGLIFTTCHPVLSTEAQVALTLRLLGGLTTEEIGRAFLTSTATIQQRIVRAKRTLQEARIPFEVPPADELDDRLSTVLNVIYLIFNEGYSATSGDDWFRTELCQEAMRLGRILATLAPEEPEVHGLLALMELQASRLRARIDREGKPVLLDRQDRSRWDHLLIRRGLGELQKAISPSGLGLFGLQAAIASCHATARTFEQTDWSRIAALYDALGQIAPSPVIELNRAVAYSRAFGPAEGLAILDPLLELRSLASYHLLHATRADFLETLGRLDEAVAELKQAIELVRNEPELELLQGRLAAVEARANGED